MRLQLADKRALCDRLYNIAKQTSIAFKFNKDQEVAYNIMISHVVGDDSCKPLQMFISGVGGTGKSHIIDAVI